MASRELTTKDVKLFQFFYLVRADLKLKTKRAISIYIFKPNLTFRLFRAWLRLKIFFGFWPVRVHIFKFGPELVGPFITLLLTSSPKQQCKDYTLLRYHYFSFTLVMSHLCLTSTTAKVFVCQSVLNCLFHQVFITYCQVILIMLFRAPKTHDTYQTWNKPEVLSTLSQNSTEKAWADLKFRP